MVLDTLYLVIPLLKRHFGLAWSGITTENVARGTHPESSCEHAEEMTNICSRLMGVSGCCGDSSHPNPLSHLGSNFLPLGSPFPLPPGILRPPGLIPLGIWPPLFGPFHFGGPPMPSTTGHHPDPKHPWSVLFGMWTMEPPISSLLRWAQGGEAMCQLPYSGYKHLNTTTASVSKSLSTPSGSPYLPLCTIWLHPSLWRSWDKMECHYTGSWPICTFDYLNQFHHPEFGPFLLKQLPWIRLTY